MNESELIEAIERSVSRPLPQDALPGDELTLGIEVAETGARCSIMLPAVLVERREPGQAVDIDLQVSGEVLRAFLERTIDAASLARAIETREVTVKNELEPRKLLDLLRVIDSFLPFPPRTAEADSKE